MQNIRDVLIVVERDLSIVENVESYLVGMKRNLLSHATIVEILVLSIVNQTNLGISRQEIIKE
jgi:hypothetical protein